MGMQLQSEKRYRRLLRVIEKALTRLSAESDKNISRNASYRKYLENRYQAYIEQRRRTDDNSISISAKYDQWILTIAGGALGISLAFIEKIASNPVSMSLPILALAWLLLVGSLLFGLLAIRFSSIELQRARDVLDEQYRHFKRTSTMERMQGESFPSRADSFGSRIKGATTMSLWFLIAGCLMLCVFSVLNIYARHVDSEPDRIEVSFAAVEDGQMSRGETSMKTFPAQAHEVIKPYIPPDPGVPENIPTPIKLPDMETYVPPPPEEPPPEPEK
jgi:hypothetical protein